MTEPTRAAPLPPPSPKAPLPRSGGVWIRRPDGGLEPAPAPAEAPSPPVEEPVPPTRKGR